MPKRSSKADLNQTAFNIVQQSIGAVQTSGRDSAPSVQASGQAKNPAAVALGRLGGLKGGKARAKSLSSRKRTEIAKKAAASRWYKNKIGK